jgi:hypothetical protein
MRLEAENLSAISVIWVVQSWMKKHSVSLPAQITCISIGVSSHSEGRLAIVTDAGRDAVDAEVPITNGAEADGEAVWS